MDDAVERLKAMLGSADVWQDPTQPEPCPSSELIARAELDKDSDPDDPEKVLNFDHRIGGRLEHAIGHAEVHAIVDFPKYELEVGQEAPIGEFFCALKALVKYPYDYICRANSGRVAREFFDRGSLYERPWDFFYIYPPHSPFTPNLKGIVLVPARQVQHFLVTINNTLDTHIKIPDAAFETGFVIDFPNNGTPRPRYLGHTYEREMAECLKQAIPSASYRPSCESDATTKPDNKSLDAFKKQIDLLLASDKKKKAGTKEKRRAERFAKQKVWSHSIKRVQRYLGLREAHSSHSEIFKTDSDPKFERHQQDQVADESLLSCDILTAMELEKPAPFRQEDSVVFVCVDVEAFERDNSLVTEIGIAVLDTADIINMSPGVGGVNWRDAIRARHFRVKEYEHLRNKDFLSGCPEYFQFGQSEWISIKDAPHEISKCFKPPYSGPSSASPIEREDTVNGELNEKRNIVMVGHDIISDINYLRKIGYDPNNLSNLQELIDTSSMYRAFQRETNPRNLGSILASLDIAGWYLHNAGNDAVYTLQAMIGIAINALTEKPDEVSQEMQSKIRIAESIKIAAEAAQEALEGWSSDGSDGGPPTGPIVQLRSDRKKNERLNPNSSLLSASDTTEP